MTRRDAIARAFDGAIDYDAHSTVQREVAGWLAERIVGTGPHPSVLEIGCGTGSLAALAARPAGARAWWMTDISAAMLQRSRARLGAEPPFRYRQLDGEDPQLDGEEPFDLVCSSLAAQWFGNLHTALTRQLALLRPGGRLLLTTLVDGTFAEWRAAVATAGGEAGTPAFLSVDALAALSFPDATLSLTSRRFTARADTSRDLLDAIKRIGAGTPRSGARPLPPSVLKEAMRRLDRQGSELGYEVAMIEIAERPSP